MHYMIYQIYKTVVDKNIFNWLNSYKTIQPTNKLN